jgi:ribosomal protein S18 acetylase RimI-like enzyme
MPTIGPATPADRPGLAQVLGSDDTFRDDERAVALELVDAALEGSDDYWLRVARLPALPVAGYLCYGPTPMTASTYDLYWIVSHAAARGQGVAGALIRAMEDDLRGRGATGIRVETSELESYGAARTLYDRLGYPEVARLPDFYRPGDGLIIYYKQL